MPDTMNFCDKVTVGLIIVSVILSHCEAQFKVIRLLDSDVSTPKIIETKTTVSDDAITAENVSVPSSDTTDKISTTSETSVIKIHLMDSQELKLSEVTDGTEAVEAAEVTTKAVESTTVLAAIELGYKPRSYQSK